MTRVRKKELGDWRENGSKNRDAAKMRLPPERGAAATLKKQVGCFNHRVVALVAIMSGLCEVSFGIRDLIAQGNQRGSCSGHLTTTILLIVTTTM